MMIEGNKNTVTFENSCPWCGRDYTWEVPTEGYDNWRGGMLIQDAFPTLSATEREYFLTGFCAECQKKIFGDEEEG